MQQAFTLHTIDHAAMCANQRFTQQAFDYRLAEMQRRSAQYATSQQSPQAKVIREGVHEIHGGAVTQFIAWWEYADGTYEEFDGTSWTRFAAGQKRPARAAADH